MAPPNRPDDNDLLAALRHPLRRRILRELAGGGSASPRQLSSTLRQPLSNVSYHVRVLVDRRVVALVETRPSRGSVEHFYRLALKAQWARQVLGLGDEDGCQAGKGPGGTAT